MRGFGFAVKPELLQPPPLQDYPLATYIRIGDEPDIKVVIINFADFLDADTFSKMKENLKFLPRSELGGILEREIQPIVASDYFLIVKKSYINLFNQVNTAEAAARQLSPWDWEKTKMRAVYQSNAENDLDQNSLAYQLSTAMLVEDAEKKIIENLNTQYASLPKLGNLGAEASRQAAIIGLINLKEYEMVQKVINVYKAAKPEETEVLINPPANLSTLAPTLLTPIVDIQVTSPEISNVLDQNPVNISNPADYIPLIGVFNPLLSLIRR